MQKSAGISLIGLVIAATAVIILFVIIVRLISRGAPATTAAIPGEQETERVLIEELVDYPQAYTDLTINVDAQVVDWITKRSFVISESAGTFASPGNILVINPQPYRLPGETVGNELPLGKKRRVSVTGRVVRTNLEEIRNNWDSEMTNEDLSTDDELVIIAESVVVI